MCDEVLYSSKGQHLNTLRKYIHEYANKSQKHIQNIVS